jgi:uncharacterized membrane protein YfcA
MAIGFVSGLLGGLLGVGGGFVLVPLQVLYAQQSQYKAHGTSLAAVIPIAVVGAAVYYIRPPQPQVDLRFAGLLVVGGVVGAYLGARLLKRLPERQLKTAVALLLAAVAVKEIAAP